jgi:hypothetical protein
MAEATSDVTSKRRTGDGAPVLARRALNRALLARQGLLDRLDLPLDRAVEAIGAVQAQHWAAVPVALWSRIDGFEPAALHQALTDRELVVGTLLRVTLHLVSAREHPAYAAAVSGAGLDDWRRTGAAASAEVDGLRERLRSAAGDAPVSGKELADTVEAWLREHPGAIDAAEVDHQRTYAWRAMLRWSGLVRAPADGRWGSKAPAAYGAAPKYGEPPAFEAAVEAVVRRHLRAFGPAAADDVAGWTGLRTPVVRAAVERIAPELAEFRDEAGRPLHDLPDAPRPDPETPAAPRMLAGFDSALLAYASAHRARILPDAHREAVYERANLRILPTFLVDGFVAGTWSLTARRREATVTLRPLAPLPRQARAALTAEAERLAGAMHPGAAARVVVE